jgi:hypothetical protein
MRDFAGKNALSKMSMIDSNNTRFDSTGSMNLNNKVSPYGIPLSPAPQKSTSGKIANPSTFQNQNIQ